MEGERVGEEIVASRDGAVTSSSSAHIAALPEEPLVPVTEADVSMSSPPVSSSAAASPSDTTAEVLQAAVFSEPTSEPSIPIKLETEEPIATNDPVPTAIVGPSVSAPKKKKTSSSVKKDSAASKLKKSSAKKASVSGTFSRPKLKQEEELRSRSPTPSLNDEVEDEVEDPNLYCICHSRFDDVEGGMIMCDQCDLWFHYRCMGMDQDNVELVDQFICPLCEAHTTDRTTYKEPCSRSGCKRTAMKPFSRYCSERCGVLQIAAKVQALKLSQNPPLLDNLYQDPRVKRARRTEGKTQRTPDILSSPTWNASFQDSILHSQTANMNPSERFSYLSAATDGPSQALSTEPNGHSIRPSSAHTLDLEREPDILRVRLVALDLQKARINAALDSLDQRSTLLHLVSDRAPTLPPVGASSTSTIAAPEPVEEDAAEEAAVIVQSAKSKSNKKKKAADSSSIGGPRCGYDERLHWDDETFDAWARTALGRSILSQELPLDGILDDEQADAGQSMDTSDNAATRTQPSICSVSKRKCKRHVDWSNLKEASFDVEKSVLNHESQKITEEKLQLERTLQEVEETIVVAKELLASDEERTKRVAARRDEELAKMIASEGSRRAIRT